MEFRTYLMITLFVLLAAVSGLAYYFATKSPAPQPPAPRLQKEEVEEKRGVEEPQMKAVRKPEPKSDAAPQMKMAVEPARPESKFGTKVDAVPQMMIPPPQKAVPPPPPPPMKAPMPAPPPPQMKTVVEPARPESKVGGPLEVKAVEAVKMDGKIEEKRTADEMMKIQELARQKDQAALQQKMAAEAVQKVFGKAEPGRPGGVMIGGAFIQPQQMAAEPAVKYAAMPGQKIGVIGY